MSWLTPDNTRGTGAPSDLSITTDPLLANRYNYVNGDPINLTDPSGHYSCDAEEGRAARDACRQGLRMQRGAARREPTQSRQEGVVRPSTLRDLTDAMSGAGLDLDVIGEATNGFDELNIRIVTIRIRGESYFILSDGYSSAVFTQQFSGTFVVARATPTDLSQFAQSFGSAASRIGTAIDLVQVGAAFLDGLALAEGESVPTQIWSGLGEAAPVAAAILIDAGLFRAGAGTCAASGSARFCPGCAAPAP